MNHINHKSRRLSHLQNLARFYVPSPPLTAKIHLASAKRFVDAP